jgi:hypothetical protein
VCGEGDKILAPAQQKVAPKLGAYFHHRLGPLSLSLSLSPAQLSVTVKTSVHGAPSSGADSLAERHREERGRAREEVVTVSLVRYNNLLDIVMADMDVQPLDLSCPPKFWLAAAVADHHPASACDLSTTGNKMTATATSYAKLSVAIPRRYSNCSDNVSFADSDRSPSISPASHRFRQQHLSDSELSSSLGSDSEGDPSPGPLVTRGPATKRFLSKYIKEQVGKCAVLPVATFGRTVKYYPTLLCATFLNLFNNMLIKVCSCSMCNKIVILANILKLLYLKNFFERKKFNVIYQSRL